MVAVDGQVKSGGIVINCRLLLSPKMHDNADGIEGRAYVSVSYTHPLEPICAIPKPSSFRSLPVILVFPLYMYYFVISFKLQFSEKCVEDGRVISKQINSLLL
jgi:hypothetical protein